MSYPQFNLTTLQLPAPVSNMTKAEYKAAYGIDLDQVDIKAFKLVLLGKDKYPITQIKEVEDGYEIYFNGRVLSITDIVQTSDEVYDVANSKPIYLHPVSLYGSNIRGQCLIFNNSPTAFNLEGFLNYLDNLYTQVGDTTRILCNGGYVKDNAANIMVYLGKDTSGGILKYYINYVTLAGQINSDYFTREEFVALFTSVNDGVNKIN